MQIVDAAAAVFLGRDPAEVTFEEIAEAAGVSRALVYNYFGDRHGLLEAVHERNVSRLQALISDAMADLPVSRSTMAGAVRVHLDFARTDPAGYRSAAGQHAFPRLPLMQQRRVDSIAVNMGGGPDARLVARGVLAAVHAMVIYWLDSGGHDVDRAAEVITAFVWDGLADAARIGLHLTTSWMVPAPDSAPDALF